MFELTKHPCFNENARHTYSRIHLPVAPSCNIQCNYCNRKYDCVNESRPGVTSAVLKPFQALEYIKQVNDKLTNLSVIGIAGPGDAFANPDETLETLSLVRKEFPDMLLCVSTNGLNIAPYINDLVKLKVSHITLTINSFDLDELQKIYAWVRFRKRVYRGIEGAYIMIEEQTKSLTLLKKADILVKVNTIFIPGINGHSIVETAKKLGVLGADTMNCMPLIPAKGTPFEKLAEPEHETIKKIRKDISGFIKPMNHCARCRADAAGLLGQDKEETKCILQKLSSMKRITDIKKDKVAVATHENLLVNRHLGEAENLSVFGYEDGSFIYLESRKTPASGGGDQRWFDLAGILSDCHTILVSGAGPKPAKILEKHGINIIQMTGLIQSGLEAAFEGKPLKAVSKSEISRCGISCTGNANGCS
ncbi:MAG: nitrogenase cofactor biosynthesis protein NifB [Bacteroidales bacterium]